MLKVFLFLSVTFSDGSSVSSSPQGLGGSIWFSTREQCMQEAASYIGDEYKAKWFNKYVVKVEPNCEEQQQK